jgi:bacillithiol biosynthesis deacetylase BshB1
MKEEMTIDVLAFGPHPDDVEMCCGGTIAKTVKMGYTAGIIDLTGGELGTRGDRETRLREAAEAEKLLGINVRENLDLGDGRITNNESARSTVIKKIRTYRPTLVLAPYWMDDHPDHIQCSLIVKDSAYLAGLVNYNPDQPPHKPKGILYYMCRHSFHPTLIINITDEFEQKISAIKAYSSQISYQYSAETEIRFNENDFLKYIEARARFFGMMINCKFGEPFFSVYPPQVLDPIAMLGGGKW